MVAYACRSPGNLSLYDMSLVLHSDDHFDDPRMALTTAVQ
jgi:hypothetical protein